MSSPVTRWIVVLSILAGSTGCSGGGGATDAGAGADGADGAAGCPESGPHKPGSGTALSTCGNFVNCRESGRGETQCQAERGLSADAAKLVDALVLCQRKACCDAPGAACGMTGGPSSEPICDTAKASAPACCACNHDAVCGGTEVDMGPPDPKLARCAQERADCFDVPICKLECKIASGC